MSENEKESATENTTVNFNDNEKESAATEETIDNTIVFGLNPYCPPDAELFNNDNDNVAALERKYIKLCRIAKIDAWHDHHTINGLEPKEISDFVSEHIPADFKCYNAVDGQYTTSSRLESLHVNTINHELNDEIQPSDENTFLWRYLLNVETYLNGGETLQKKMKDMVKPHCNEYIPNYEYVDDNTQLPLFNEKYITSRYIVGHVPFISTSDNDNINCSHIKYENDVSQVQRFFEEHQINEDIYIIRDVAYGNWADDIRKWKQNATNPTKIVTIQSAAGIFDPGPSTHYYSSAGVRQGFSDISSESYYGLFDSTEDEETKILYPKIEEDDDDDDDEEEEEEKKEKKKFLRNQLLFTRFDCTLHGHTKDRLSDGVHERKTVQNFIESANTTLVVKDGENYYLSRKNNSNKAQSITELPKQDVIIHLTSKQCGELNKNIGTTYEFQKYISNSGKMRIMSKKFGDHGQAVTACRSKLYYKRFVPTNSTNNVQIISEESNGIHAFLSFDRVAVVSAIYYGAPIVIFTNHYGALIFLSKTLKESVTTPKTKLDSIKLSIERKETEYNTKFKEVQKLEQSEPLGTKIAVKISNIENSLVAIQTYIQEIYNYLLSENAYEQHARGDIVYQSLLSILFMSRTFINFYMTNIVENSFKFMENEVSKKGYNMWKNYYNAHIAEQDPNEETEETIKSDILKRIEFLNGITTRTNQLQNNISNYIIIENVENGLNQIASIITTTENNDSYKRIYNIMSQLKISSTTKERFDSCNPYSGTQNPRYWRSKLKKESYQNPLGVSLCLPDFVVITENIDDYVFKKFTLSPDPDVKKDVTFSVIFTIILNRLYNKCQPDLKPYLYVSLGLIYNSEDSITLDPNSRCSLNLKSIVDIELLLEKEDINFDLIEDVAQQDRQTEIGPIPNVGTAPESTLSVNEIAGEERTGGFVREPYNLRSQVKITRSGNKYGGKQNRKKRMKRTKRRKIIKKRRTKRKRKVCGGSETQTQTTTTKTEFGNLSSEQLQERGKIILENLNKYPKNRSDIRKNNLQRELIMINNFLDKRGEKPVTQTQFPGEGKKIEDSSSKYFSVINNSIRNIIIIMKQNKVVRDANPMDRLTKSFDEVIRRAHILKQCEVALTIIGKLILMNNPNLMKDSEIKSQNGGAIDKIADKIKKRKTDEFNSPDQEPRIIGFDDTHPFTLLESMINYNGLLKEISNVFIEQYDLEIKINSLENLFIKEESSLINTIFNLFNNNDIKVKSKYIIDNIKTVLGKNKKQLFAAYKIQEEDLERIYVTIDNKQLPKYPETYEDDKIDINNENKIDDIIDKLNQEPPIINIRISTRVNKGQRKISNMNKKGDMELIPTPGNR